MKREIAPDFPTSNPEIILRFIQYKNPKMTKKQKKHEGKSYGLCTKCGSEFKLKRKTKHSIAKRPKGICPSCGIKTKK